MYQPCTSGQLGLPASRQLRPILGGTLLVLASVALSACAEITNSGSTDEVRGLNLIEDVQNQASIEEISPEPTTLGSTQTAEEQSQPTTQSISTTGLVEGWPQEYPLPSGVEITLSSRTDNNGEIDFSASFVGSLSFEETVGHFAVVTDGIYPETDELTSDQGQRSLVRVFRDSPSRLLTITVEETDGGSRGTISIAGYWQAGQ